MKLAAILLALAATSAHAADARLKCITYDPDAVVRINAVAGLATQIDFARGETVVTEALGDPEAWTVMSTGNHFFLKPKAANSDTNLTIITDKRAYMFILHYVDAGAASPWANKSATLRVSFKYPDEARTHAVADNFKARAAAYNLNYTESATQADQEIAPLNVWDDGRFTYFKFAENTDLPNVYTVTANGDEALVNRHMASGRVIVAEKVGPRFYLRLGDAVVGVYNDAYNRAGVPNTTGTSVATVERVIKGAGE